MASREGKALANREGKALANRQGKALARHSPKKALFIRLDKIGDLVCTFPVDQIERFAPYEKQWVISKGLGFLAENSSPKRSFQEISSKEYDSETLKKFLDFLKSEKFDEAYSFQAPWWVNYALWKARIPNRYGVLSKWHSFLFLNKGLRQKRSRSTQHEFEYNLDIVNFDFANSSQAPASTSKKSGSEYGVSKSDLFLKLEAPEGLFLNEATAAAVTPPFIVVHAGMAGSALNWPQENYIQLIEGFLKVPEFQNFKVLLTGTNSDIPYLEDILRHFLMGNSKAAMSPDLKAPSLNPRVINLVSQLNIKELLVVLKKAELVFAPSTGVLHLACALQVPTVSVYSPIQVHHPIRWGPRSPVVAKVFLPEVAADKLIDEACMKQITPENVLGSIVEILSARKSS